MNVFWRIDTLPANSSTQGDKQGDKQKALPGTALTVARAPQPVSRPHVTDVRSRGVVDWSRGAPQKGLVIVRGDWGRSVPGPALLSCGLGLAAEWLRVDSLQTMRPALRPAAVFIPRGDTRSSCRSRTE